MKRAIALFIGLCFLVWARATTEVPIFQVWWWVWIIGTCVVAGCLGWVIRDAQELRKCDD